jgi:hypothetical protein
MNRRTAILGGAGVVGVAALGVYVLRDKAGQPDASPLQAAAKPMLVFVGHEL